MKRDLFQFVPSEITINILSRLHVRAIAMSKCVCKPWLDLLETDDFVNSHLSKSVPVLAALMNGKEYSKWCKVFEFEDGDEADDDDVDRRYIPLTKFDFSHRTNLVAAADGLLLLANYETLHICNPMTREYVELCCASKEYVVLSYGFGSSKITGQHKAVQIIPKRYSGCNCRVNVYTLETGSWRRFEIEATTASFRDWQSTYGAFVNGNLHWIGSRSKSFTCFDLETERFSMFSAPPLEETGCDTSICTLKDYMCMCAVRPFEEDGNYKFGVEIWLMKEYGVEKSWTKEYVVSLHPNPVPHMGVCDYFYPMKVFKDGDILFSRGDLRSRLFHYSNKTQTSHKIGVLHPPGGYLYSLLLTPSFLSLKRNLGMENVISF